MYDCLDSVAHITFMRYKSELHQPSMVDVRTPEGAEAPSPTASASSAAASACAATAPGASVSSPTYCAPCDALVHEYAGVSL